MVDVGIYGVRSRLGKLSAPLWGQFEVQGGSEALFFPWARNNLEEKINHRVFHGLDQHCPIEHSIMMKCSISVRSIMVLLVTGGWLVSTRYVASATE